MHKTTERVLNFRLRDSKYILMEVAGAYQDIFGLNGRFLKPNLEFKRNLGMVQEVYWWYSI